MYNDIYRGKKVLVTGCNGFKGSWLCQWLIKLGAKVTGWGHAPNTKPSHAILLNKDYHAEELVLPRCGSVKYLKADFDIVFHLAAHAIVARTFDDPHETIENNVMAATGILEMVRKSKCKGVVLITTDKVYKDENWIWGYRENDTLGGYDPYSTSKVCIEHVIEMYRKSYGMNIATARAGNVIGGGDWSEKRIFPDIVKATAEGKKVQIHTPNATRPWQHVLSALDGYLLLGEKILKGEDVNSAWNFGPTEEMTVLEVLEVAKWYWDEIDWEIVPQETHPNMVNLLKIDSTKARKFLGWNPPWDMKDTIIKTVLWYKKYYKDRTILTNEHIGEYTAYCHIFRKENC